MCFTGLSILPVLGVVCVTHVFHRTKCPEVPLKCPAIVLSVYKTPFTNVTAVQDEYGNSNHHFVAAIVTSITSIFRSLCMTLHNYTHLSEFNKLHTESQGVIKDLMTIYGWVVSSLMFALAHLDSTTVDNINI